MKSLFTYLILLLSWFCAIDAKQAPFPTYPSTYPSTGSTQGYLKHVPLDTIIELYSTHPITKEDPSLIEFARFFQNNRPVFNKIIQVEEANSERYYIFYHGVNGQRLIFDTLRVLYNRTHKKPLPHDFMLLRDPRDPDVRTDDIQQTLSARWPSIPLKHQKIILEALIGDSIDKAKVPLLWNLISGDIDWNEDLSAQERDLLKGFSQRSLLDYHDKFLSLSRLEWQNPYNKLSAKEKQYLIGIDTMLITRGYEIVLRALHILENNVDYSPIFRSRNLAVNLALFSGCISYHPSLGLYPTKHECTPLYWFAQNLGYHQFEAAKTLRQAKLLPILERYGIPSDQLQALEAIYQTLQPEDDQLLLQILVPREYRKTSDESFLNRFFYISHAVGRPAYYLSPLLATQVIERYQRSPLSLPAFLQLQGRFLFTEEGLLNPHSGIRILVYHLPKASKQRIDSYLTRLKVWARSQPIDHKHAGMHAIFSKNDYNGAGRACQRECVKSLAVDCITW